MSLEPTSSRDEPRTNDGDPSADALRAARAHGLTLSTPLQLVGQSEVWLAEERDGTRRVLKVAHDADDEADALVRYASTGAVPRLIARSGRVLVLEHVPGPLLRTQPWAAEDHVAAGRLARRLHTASTPGRADVTLRRRLDRWREEDGHRLSPKLLAAYDHAAGRAMEAPHAYLHADFHPNNIVRAETGVVVAIDPFGRSGPASFDLALHAFRTAIEQPGAPARPSATLRLALHGYGVDELPALSTCLHLLVLWHAGWILAGSRRWSGRWLLEAAEDARFELIDELAQALAAQA